MNTPCCHGLRIAAFLISSFVVPLASIKSFDGTSEGRPAARTSPLLTKSDPGQGASGDATQGAATEDKSRIYRIYLTGRLRVKVGEGEARTERGTFVIDPQTGLWRKLLDRGEHPRVSPDGETLAFSHEKGIWTCDTHEALAPGRLAEVSGGPSWMPDGKNLVATSAKLRDEGGAKGWLTETWQIRFDGSGKTPLPIPSTDWVTDISPDGKWFVTCGDRIAPHEREFQLYVMRPDGSEQKRIAQNGVNVHARFSPDSRRILYLCQSRDANNLKIVNVDGTNERTVLSENAGANAVDIAAWSRDGKSLAVIRFDWQINDQGIRFLNNAGDTKRRLEITDSDGGNVRTLNLQGAEIRYVSGLDWR